MPTDLSELLPPGLTCAAEPLGNYARACLAFDALVQEVRHPQWDARTPCAEWTVRDLINHVTVENLWAAELFSGATVSEVGSMLDGDQLGSAPLPRWTDAARVGLAAAAAPGALTRTVHLSFGDVPGAEYARQLFADHLIHAWDLATALGLELDPDPALVAACQDWFVFNEDAYRAAGVVGPRPVGPDRADALVTLLTAFGRTP